MVTKVKSYYNNDSEHSFGHVCFGSIDYKTDEVTKAKDCTSKQVQ